MFDDESNILYIDDFLLVVNKPSGLLTIPDGYNPEIETARSLLEPEYGHLWIVHRLDKGTSGILVLARDKDTHRALNQQFASHEVRKEYHLVALGIPDQNQWDVALPLLVNGNRSHHTTIDLQAGKTAFTHFSVIDRFTSGYSCISAQPYTGYTHQIRAHLTASGLSIAGDPLYKPKPHPSIEQQVKITPPKNLITANRLMLHAWSIQVNHPVYKTSLSIHAPYPDDFNQFLQTVSEK